MEGFEGCSDSGTTTTAALLLSLLLFLSCRGGEEAEPDDDDGDDGEFDGDIRLSAIDLTADAAALTASKVLWRSGTDAEAEAGAAAVEAPPRMVGDCGGGAKFFFSFQAEVFFSFRFLVSVEEKKYQTKKRASSQFRPVCLLRIRILFCKSGPSSRANLLKQPTMAEARCLLARERRNHPSASYFASSLLIASINKIRRSLFVFFFPAKRSK